MVLLALVPALALSFHHVPAIGSRPTHKLLPVSVARPALQPVDHSHITFARPNRAAVQLVDKDGPAEQKPSPNPSQPGGGGPLSPFRVLSILAGLVIAGSVAADTFGPKAPPAVVLPYSELVKEVDKDQVAEAVFAPTERELFVRTKEGVSQRVDIFPGAQGKLADQLSAKDVPYSVARAPVGNPIFQAFGSVLNFAFPLLLLSAFFGPGAGPGGPAGMGGSGGPLQMLQNLGKSRSEVQLVPDTGVTFADVAGCDASKLELREVVDFLSSPDKYQAVGARAPKGVLLEGPPGTGKTLLARAVAGEAGVPFISASGSEFVEMFVGVGASRIRDLFAKAKENGPCIVFIDEIDAIGKSRSTGGVSGGGNDEREQTLNQILTEMDGFEKNTGIVVIAATNRNDVLDTALTRPGRFDRRVPVDLPDRDGRRAILNVHARDKPLGADVDLDSVAGRTTGFSGAALANLMNEAAIVAARRDKTSITMSEVEYALDRLTVGLERRTGMASEKRKRLVAYHEAGHAVMGALTPGFDSVGKVTIVPRSNGAGGFTLFVPSEEQQDSGLYSRKYLEAQLAVALGGRVAEEIVYGAEDVTTGASGDLQRVAEVARKMVTQWGFASELLGPTAWEGPMGSNIQTPKMASEATQQRVDEAVEAIVRKAYDECKTVLTHHRALLDNLADRLVEQETVGNDELADMVKRYVDQEAGAHVRAAGV